MSFIQSHGLSLTIFLPVAGAIALMLLPRQMGKAFAVVISLAVLVVASMLAWDYQKDPTLKSVEQVFGERIAQLEKADSQDPTVKDMSPALRAAEVRELREALKIEQAKHLKFVEYFPWIKSFRINYFLAADGFSMPLIWLSAFLTPICLIYSWNVEKLTSAYYALFLILEAGIIGVFCALDLFLFYVFWEIVLLPMYFLIGIWGGPRRIYASIKFFIYTLVGSVLMLIAFLYMYFQLEPNSFNLLTLQAVVSNPLNVSVAAQKWLFFALFIGFAIKVPVFPFHTWLPDAHVEAPTAASMVLAGILLKMGVYGFFRFIYPMFPEIVTMSGFVYFIAILGMINIVYGALVAMAQTDFKALVAYSSISAMGYCLLGIASLTSGGMLGGALQSFNHGLESPMLFCLVGVVYERAHHRNLNDFGGIGLQMPWYTGMAIIGFFAALGLPGLNMFIGEALTFLGAYMPESLLVNGTKGIAGIDARWIIYVSLSGVVFTAAYVLWTVQRVFFGPIKEKYLKFRDLNAREVVSLVPLAVLCILFGVLPHILIDYMEPSLNAIIKTVQRTAAQ
jgi:NADH-quinone oxidoreductase subunit M